MRKKESKEDINIFQLFLYYKC